MCASAMPEQVTASAGAAWAREVCAGIHAAGCRSVVHVPDNPLAHVLRVLADDYPGVRTVLATREEEAFGIAAGLYLGGDRSAVMLQSSGLGNSLNAIGSLLVAYRIPVLMLISMRGGPGEWNEAQVPMGRAVPSLLEALAIQHTTAARAGEAGDAVRASAGLAFSTRMPAACLLNRSLTATGRMVTHDASDEPELIAAGGAASGDVDRNIRPPALAPAATTGRMSRLDATRLVATRLRREAVIASLGHPAYDLFAAGDRPENFYTWGSMGMASSVGLGLALALPERRVFVCDGDGSLLMNLGSIATIATTRPRNLTLLVWDNERYGTTGGQRSATASGSDLAGAARALGMAFSATVHTPDDLTACLDHVDVIDGPALIVAKVTESGTLPKPPLDCVFLKQRFMAALGVPDPATRGGDM
jgi:sulfopyruvate decarboxylase alpha subunit